MQVIKILLPIFQSHTNFLFFKGYIDTSKECYITIFITTFERTSIFTNDTYMRKNVILGCFSEGQIKMNNCENYFILKKNKYPQIKSLVIQGKQQNKENIILLLYDYNKVRYTETISNSDDYFPTLQRMILMDVGDFSIEKDCEPIFKKMSWLCSSMFIQYTYNYINLLRWLIISIKNKRKISIKQGNLLLAILVDVILGCLILQLIVTNKKNLHTLLMGTLEKLVNSMYSLLQWLMGAPAGLKLNNAFNKMLGKYYLYHVELWWLFLDVSGEKLDIILHVYQYIGYLGFTFQAAIISDMICLATFHSYCIYVYAARLFSIQISGLIALMRLFVGRKYNPLRGGIDSCEYTNQELFVGTVAFTILLLLLPTTLMYYIVFTMFRVLSLTVHYALAKIIYTIQTLPLYVLALWISRSSKIAGNILIEEATCESATLILKMQLNNKSIKDLIKDFKPPVQMPENFEWSNILSNILTGNEKI